MRSFLVRKSSDIRCEFLEIPVGYAFYKRACHPKQRQKTRFGYRKKQTEFLRK